MRSCFVKTQQREAVQGEKQGINAREILSEWPGKVFKPYIPALHDAESIDDNRKWLNERMDEGCQIIDIGPKGDQPESKWYKMELEEIKRRGYMNIVKLW